MRGSAAANKRQGQGRSVRPPPSPSAALVAPKQRPTARVLDSSDKRGVISASYTASVNGTARPSQRARPASEFQTTLPFNMPESTQRESRNRTLAMRGPAHGRQCAAVSPGRCPQRTYLAVASACSACKARGAQPVLCGTQGACVARVGAACGGARCAARPPHAALPLVRWIM